MRRKKIWFIVNPVSGGITKDDIANLISDILSRSLYDWRICYTGYAGHGAVLATMAVENDIDVVVAVGGCSFIGSFENRTWNRSVRVWQWAGPSFADSDGASQGFGDD